MEKQAFVDGFLKLYGKDGSHADEVATPWTEKKIKGLFDVCKKDKFTKELFNDWLTKGVA